MIKMIAFDADDTLWHNETLYQDAQTQLEAILRPWSAVEQTRITLAEIELDNLSLYGYGIKAFTLSMVETVLKSLAGTNTSRSDLRDPGHWQVHASG